MGKSNIYFAMVSIKELKWYVIVFYVVLGVAFFWFSEKYFRPQYCDSLNFKFRQAEYIGRISEIFMDSTNHLEPSIRIAPTGEKFSLVTDTTGFYNTLQLNDSIVKLAGDNTIILYRNNEDSLQFHIFYDCY